MREAAGGEGARDTESKTRTPHKVVGNQEKCSCPRPKPAVQDPKMLAPNASSPCQRVSNGYLFQPLPVPNVAF